jgi:hypothetical protein
MERMQRDLTEIKELAPMNGGCLKVGAMLLSLWSGLNILVAVAVATMTLSGRNPPALSILFTDAEIHRLDGKVIAVVNAQAALANPCIVALCLVVLGTIWKGLIARMRWSFWVLVGALLPLQAFGFVSDAFLGHRNLIANLVSTAILITGLGLSGCALYGNCRLGSRV